MTRHKETLDKKRPMYPCHYCSNTFTTPGSLKNHLNCHEESREMFPCQICSKKFKSKASMKKHQRNHNSGKQKCEICAKEVYDLYQHQRSHEKEKSTCSICKATVKNIKGHMEIHVELLNQHQCSHCPKTFSLKKQLSNHMQRIHETDKKKLSLMVRCQSVWQNERHFS